ncbi:MAG: hypothetical protein DHS20C01_26500 [marine bacterium B5-7]|nr:MAG: hypothetical protein DHS20C01_26500 [marine bacterium B5-7]
MLTLSDCIELCGLDPGEVEAIAQHEHIPDMQAAELAQYLVHCDDGVPRIRRMIQDDLENASKRHDTAAVMRYRDVLKHFIATHPERDLYLDPNTD